MFRNLQAEMVRRNVTPVAISKIINKTEKSTRAKLQPDKLTEASVGASRFASGRGALAHVA